MYPTSRTAYWLITVLFVTTCLSYADRLVLSVLDDPLRQSLSLTDSALAGSTPVPASVACGLVLTGLRR